MGRLGTAGSALALLALAVTLVPALAEEATRGLHVESERGCLNPKERRALVESGAVLHLAAAMHAIRGHVSGTLVRARLCRRGEGLVYLLTVLAHDGKVTRLTVDATKGTLVSGR